MRNRVTVHIQATSSVEFHCDLGADRVGLRLDDGQGSTSMYVDGTPEEIRALGDRLIMEANRQQARIDARQSSGVAA